MNDAADHDGEGDEADWDDLLAALDAQEGWHADEFAARVHYRGADDYYSIEYYAPSDCVLYWKVKDDGDVAVPVSRETVPDPLRKRIRQDLSEADIDAAVEARVV